MLYNQYDDLVYTVLRRAVPAALRTPAWGR